jgi:predicted ATP-binding protein involved in virulence
MELSFEVIPKSYPPTNIHVIIGRNGVGKTHLLNNMINSLVENNNSKYGFSSEGEKLLDRPLFANLISITFSAFDDSEPPTEKKDKTEGINYAYIVMDFSHFKIIGRRMMKRG